jgi:hypothetical protein
MDKYKKIYDTAFYDGMIDAYKDYNKNKRKKFKKVKDKEIKSKIYDKGFINGYNIFFDIVKNDTM